MSNVYNVDSIQSERILTTNSDLAFMLRDLAYVEALANAYLTGKEVRGLLFNVAIKHMSAKETIDTSTMIIKIADANIYIVKKNDNELPDEIANGQIQQWKAIQDLVIKNQARAIMREICEKRPGAKQESSKLYDFVVKQDEKEVRYAFHIFNSLKI